MSISGNKSIVVRRVFAEDLDNIEFPGTIFKPSKQVIREGNPVINYHYMKSNVDALQIIQLGLSLSDAQVIYQTLIFYFLTFGNLISEVSISIETTMLAIQSSCSNVKG
ncbi:hypothetical protein Goklo_000081 [Gossypium klotzschianum]|uniref:Uncharacterized protein n=1 Tax=Gossypium klotzschianum TaxID=34286 RepID=A0A7J8W6E0_9ROSI|nr:hypothetical protein [Gossypium klotzschianum]